MAEVEKENMTKDVQIIGLDIGRGYVKGYTEYKKKKRECLFKSVIGDGREIDFDTHEDPVYINFEGQNYFAGILAEKESFNAIRNADNRKTSLTMRVLIAAALNKLAVADEVKIMLGVPYISFNKTVLAEVRREYKGKTYEIKDNIENTIKKVTIDDISILREGDAALICTLDGKKNQEPVALAAIGYRTTELTYFNPGLEFVDKFSKTYEFGNQDALSIIQKQLEERGISKETYEIDTSDKYDDMKKFAYESSSEKIQQYISNLWKNLNELTVYISGGTALYMNFDERFKVIENAQMATAKGLYIVASDMFQEA